MARGGWKLSEETKKKMSLAQKGNTHAKGRVLSEETKRKIGEANKAANPATIYDYICQTCGTGFQSRKKDRKFCNIKCKRIEKICKSCDEVFAAKSSNTKYCESCLKSVCNHCGFEFRLSSSQLDGSKHNGPRKYCSSKCYHESTIGKEPCNKKDPIDLECQFCGKGFQVIPARKSKARFCSKRCAYDSRSLVTGPAHPLWKGGYNLYGRLISENEGSFYRNRAVVLGRDDNTCCHCGYQGESKYMDVHHIVPVRERGPNTPENMLTLCRKCHNHADHGRINRDLLFSYIEFKNEKCAV